jgi:hypothetical protein
MVGYHCFRRYKKSESDYRYGVFYYYRKLVKTSLKQADFDELKSVDDNLRTHPTKRLLEICF